MMNTIEAAGLASNKFLSISFHSPIIRMKNILNNSSYNIQVNSYKASLDFYVYDFDFTQIQQYSPFIKLTGSNPSEPEDEPYQGSDLSEQDQDFLFNILTD
jgi:hypothetical protein